MQNSDLENKESLLKRKIILLLLLLLNFILFILNNSVNYDLTSSNDLSITNNNLANDILSYQIKQGNSDGLLIFNEKFEPMPTNVTKYDWEKNNKLNILFPSAKVRYNINLYNLKTKNSKLNQNGTIYIDTLYPGASDFGFGILNNSPEIIHINNNKMFYFTGSKIKNSFNFNNTKKEWINKTGQNKYKVTLKNTEIILVDKYKISHQFKKINNITYLLAKKYDERNNYISYHYNSHHKLSSIESSNHDNIIFERNSNGKVKKIINGEKQYIFTYDSNENLKSIHNDNEKKILELTHENKQYPHLLQAIKDNSKIIQFKYETLGKLKSITINNNNNITFKYGKNITQIKYNKKHYELLKSKNRIFQFTTDSDIFKMQFDKHNRCIKFQKNNYLHQKIYNKNGNLINQKINNDLYEYTYNREYSLITKITHNGQIISEREIEDGLIISEINNKIGNISYNYDDNGELIAINIENIGEYIIKRNKKSQIIKVILPNKNETIFKWVDDHLTEFIDQFGKKIKLNFTTKKELKEVNPIKGNTIFFKNPSPTTSDLFFPSTSKLLDDKIKINYNTQKLSLKDSSNNIEYKIDQFRRIREIKKDNQLISKYTFNDDHKLSEVKWSKNQFVRLNQNTKGQTTTYLTSDGNAVNIKYKNDQVSLIQSDKYLRNYHYDKKGRITKKSINVMNYFFKYSPNSSTIYSIIYPDKSKTMYSYDSKGKLSTVIFNNSIMIKFKKPNEYTRQIIFPNKITQKDEFDDNLNITSTIISNKNGDSLKELFYFYENNLYQAGSENGKRIQLNYLNNNIISSYNNENIGSFSYKFNKNGKLSEMIDSRNKKINYKMDSTGNNLAVIDLQKFIPINTAIIKGQVYNDAFNFLEINGIGTDLKNNYFEKQNFSIKPGLNVINFKGILTSRLQLDQNLSFTVHPEASSIFNYRTDKSLNSIKTYGRKVKFEWTCFNQINSIKVNKTKTEFNYLPNGLRASYKKNNKTVLYAYDIYGNIIEEIAFTGRSLVKYIYDYETNRLLMSYDGKKVRFYLTDSFGSIINIYNSKAQKIADYTYSPYGQIIKKQEQISDNKVGFMGLHKDIETGYYFFKEGYYDPENIAFYPSRYCNLFMNLENYDLNVNLSKYLQKLRLITYHNELLSLIQIPEKLSFNADFYWANHISVSNEISNLKNFLTHTRGK